jgi:hypothetical protein
VLEFYGIVCVAPLQLEGLMGKKSTPSIGWEVPVRSHQLERGRWIDNARENDFREFTFG